MPSKHSTLQGQERPRPRPTALLRVGSSATKHWLRGVRQIAALARAERQQ
jgi:hypothetical protein